MSTTPRKEFSSTDDDARHRPWYPFLSRTKTFITYEEVYGKSISYDEIVTLIQSLPTEYWLRTASMCRIFLEHYEGQDEFQGILFRYLCPQSLLEINIPTYADKERYIFHRTQFLALLRLSLLHGHNSFPTNKTEEEMKDIAAQCLLGISSLIYKEEIDKRDSTFNTATFMSKLTFNYRVQLTSSEKAFLINFLKVYNNHLREIFQNTVGRYKDMLLDIPSDANFSPQGVPRDLLSDVIRREMGLTLLEYAALTFGISVKYISPEGIFKKEFHFPVSRDTHFLHSSIDKQIVDNYFESISLSQSEFIEEQKSRGAFPGSINDSQSFMLRPLVHLDNSREYFPASLTYLQRLLESGLIWVIAGGKYRDNLRNYWGQVFEFYCHKICQRIEMNSHVKPKYFRERTYGPPHKQRRSCDAILVYSHNAVMMEFKIKSLKLVDTIINGDFDSFLEDINDAFIGGSEGEKAAAQIDTSIRAIRSGELRLPEVDPQSISAYFPVVVTLQAWPLGPFIYEFIRKIIQKEGLLRQSFVSPVEIWSAEEFEFVEAILTSDIIQPTDIPSLVREKIIGQHSNLPIYVFLQDKYPTQFPWNTYLTSQMDKMLETVIGTLSLKR